MTMQPISAHTLTSVPVEYSQVSGDSENKNPANTPATAPLSFVCLVFDSETINLVVDPTK